MDIWLSTDTIKDENDLKLKSLSFLTNESSPITHKLDIVSNAIVVVLNLYTTFILTFNR